jgi:20S proteasome subunit alpha 7
MTLIQTGYDLSSITFSPDGRIFQIEYAAKIISQSPFIIGMICKDGLVIISEKKQTNLNNRDYNLDSIFQLGKNTSIAATGSMNDIFFIVERTRFDNRNHQKFFSDSLCGYSIVTRMCNFLHIYTLYWHTRPLACSLIIATISSNFFELYLIFLSGFFIKCFAGVIGINSELIKVELESLMTKNLSCRKGIEFIIRVLKNIKLQERKKKLEILWFSKENFSFLKYISCNVTNENRRLDQVLIQ